MWILDGYTIVGRGSWGGYAWLSSLAQEGLSRTVALRSLAGIVSTML